MTRTIDPGRYWSYREGYRDGFEGRTPETPDEARHLYQRVDYATGYDAGCDDRKARDEDEAGKQQKDMVMTLSPFSIANFATTANHLIFCLLAWPAAMFLGRAQLPMGWAITICIGSMLAIDVVIWPLAYRAAKNKRLAS